LQAEQNRKVQNRLCKNRSFLNMIIFISPTADLKLEKTGYNLNAGTSVFPAVINDP
jgi:hypothetical protein